MQQGRPAVPVDFRHIFPGKGARFGKEDRQHVVQRSPFRIHDASMMHHAGNKIRETGRGRTEDPLKQMFCQRAGDPDDAHASRSRRCGHGRDGVRARRNERIAHSLASSVSTSFFRSPVRSGDLSAASSCALPAVLSFRW